MNPVLGIVFHAIGGLTFGLTMRYLGISLGVSVALGLCAMFGTLIPPIYEQFFGDGSTTTFSELLSSISGRVTLGGIGVCLVGIIICGKAGMMKEKELSPEEKTQGVKEFHFAKGIWVATVAGVLWYLQFFFTAWVQPRWASMVLPAGRCTWRLSLLQAIRSDY
ncbi:MAG: hypothetical protein DRP66_06060 [Planctomycetota bacterium]|nr:MAG: hypothetical protein DRP66_06060 [Planctomycetota bacterium]